MLTPKEQTVLRSIRENAAVTGEGDARKKSILRREQRTLLAIIDRLAGAEAMQACQLLVKWHRNVFDGGKQALRFDNGYPVDRTDVDEAERLARIALGEPKRGPRHPIYYLDESKYFTPEMLAAAPTADDILGALLCDDCPPKGHVTDKTRCRDCPRRLCIPMCDCVGPQEAEPQPCHCGKGALPCKT